MMQAWRGRLSGVDITFSIKVQHCQWHRRAPVPTALPVCLCTSKQPDDFLDHLFITLLTVTCTNAGFVWESICNGVNIVMTTRMTPILEIFPRAEAFWPFPTPFPLLFPQISVNPQAPSFLYSRRYMWTTG
jgi:hypothetical protein